ncbi:MAG: hypothetical protein Q9206_001617 [Seirophora lacunosa]
MRHRAINAIRPDSILLRLLINVAEDELQTFALAFFIGHRQDAHGAAVGEELTGKAVTPAMQSQQVELIPERSLFVNK